MKNTGSISDISAASVSAIVVFGSPPRGLGYSKSLFPRIRSRPKIPLHNAIRRNTTRLSRVKTGSPLSLLVWEPLLKMTCKAQCNAIFPSQ